MSKIELKSAIAPTLSSRDIVDVVEKLVDQNDQRRVVIDFSGVTFVSRSAADELLKLQDKYNTFLNRNKLTFENVPSDVEQILTLVEKQQRSTKRPFRQLESVDIKEFIRM
jgi:anti-anti-sigma regulatory factor